MEIRILKDISTTVRLKASQYLKTFLMMLVKVLLNVTFLMSYNDVPTFGCSA